MSASSPRPTDLQFKEITVTAADLPLHCPMPSMKLWNTHPRVFINFTDNRAPQCPYCGTVYRLSGEAKSGH